MSFWQSSPDIISILPQCIQPHCYKQTEKEINVLFFLSFLLSVFKRQLHSIILTCSTRSVEQSNILCWENALQAESLETADKWTYRLFNNLLNTAYYTHGEDVHILNYTRQNVFFFFFLCIICINEMQHPMKKKTRPLCYRSDVKVQDMLTLMRHATQWTSKFHRNRKVKLPHAVHYWASGRQSDLIVSSMPTHTR